MKTIAQQLNITDFPFTVKDRNNKEIYYENSKGYWYKSEYDQNNNRIYYEDSNGEIIDNRPKIELSMDEIAKKFNINVKDLKIKK